MRLSPGEDEENTPWEEDESALSAYASKRKALAKEKKQPRTSSGGIRKSLTVVLGLVAAVLLLFLFWRTAEGSAERKWAADLEQERAAREKAVGEEDAKVKALQGELSALKATVHLIATKTLAPELVPPRPPSEVIITPRGSFEPGPIKGSPKDVDNPNVVIDIAYPPGDYYPLPVDFLRRDEKGSGIAEALYSGDQIKKHREFHLARINFLNSRTNFQQVFLTKYNNALDADAVKEGVDANRNEWVRLDTKFGLGKMTSELFMCVMVPGYNNNANFRIEYNLNSIFSQNYTNYKVVIVNDLSTDGGGQVYRKYFAFHRIDKQRYTYVENSKRVTALHNIYVASMNFCPQQSVVVTLDADDEFIGRNVLSVFNWGYQAKKAGVLYTNFFWYQQGSTLMHGFTSDYSDHERRNNLFRSTPMKFSHLRSFWNELIFQIDPKDLQDEHGVYFTITYDIALFIPLMELACGRVYKIEGEFHYLYNTGTGLNDYNDRGRQVAVENKVRSRKKYECYKAFGDRAGK